MTHFGTFYETINALLPEFGGEGGYGLTLAEILHTSMMPLQKLPTTIKIAIGCPNHLYGEGLNRILEEEGMEVIGVFNEGSGFGQAEKMSPDDVLIDTDIFGIFCRVFTLPEGSYNIFRSF